MSRLNSSIKLLVMAGNTILLLLGTVFAIASLLIYLGRIDSLNFESASTDTGTRNGVKALAREVFLVSFGLVVLTIWGCLGSIYQTSRRSNDASQRRDDKNKSCCIQGRRLLGIHEIGLVILFVVSWNQSSIWNKRLKSLEMVMQDQLYHPNYDRFETYIAQYFNTAYFESICSSSSSVNKDPRDRASMKSSSYLFEDWVNDHCPLTMSYKVCGNQCSINMQSECDRNWLPEYCCPNQKFCFIGMSQSESIIENENVNVNENYANNAAATATLTTTRTHQQHHINNRNQYREACPYQQCRYPALKQTIQILKPFIQLIQMFVYLSALMIILTILLICYNPRDTIEIELLKAGVIAQNQIESIRQMRQGKQLSINKSGRPTLFLDNNNDNGGVNGGDLEEQTPLQRKTSSRKSLSTRATSTSNMTSRRTRRTKSSRVSPTTAANNSNEE